MQNNLSRLMKLNFLKSKNFHRLKKEVFIKGVICGTGFLAAFIFNYTNYTKLYTFFYKPLIESNVIFFQLNIFDGMFLKVNLSFFSAIFLSMPLILSQVYFFLNTILKKNELSVFRSGVLSFVVIFYIAFFILYKIEINLVLKYIALQNAQQDQIYINQNLYMRQFIMLFLINILILFLPLLLFFAIKYNLIKAEDLRRKRRVVFFIILIISAFITPPEIEYQVIMTIALYVLFELIVSIAKLLYKKNNKDLNLEPFLPRRRHKFARRQRHSRKLS